MSQRRAAVSSPRRVAPATVGAAAMRAGRIVVAITLPIAAGTAAGLVASGGSPRVVLAAVAGPLLGGSGQAYLFRVAAMGLLGGWWLVGAGLVLEGLFD